MTKICIFDLDGTLVNTLENIAGHMNKTLESYAMAPFPVDRYRYFVGNGARNLTKQVLEASGRMTPEFYEEFFARFIVAYEGAPYDGVAAYDGVLPLLDALKEKGIVLAVCSNKPHAAAVSSVKNMFPEGTFDAVLGGREGVPLKPAPDAVLSLLKERGFTRDEAVFVGDSDVDMKTAVAAGIRGYGALWGFRTADELLSAGATGLLSHPEELLTKI